MKSLMIASLPKSLSTPTYRLAAKALPLREPLPRHGEVFSLMPKAVSTLYEDRDVEKVAAHFLQYKDDCVVKDVLAPEAVCAVGEYFNILVVQRPVADVLQLRLMRSPFPWEMALPPGELRPELSFDAKAVSSKWLGTLQGMKVHLADGILWAQHMLREAADELCLYDDLVRDPETLWGALRRLGYDPKVSNYAAFSGWSRTAQARLSLRRTKEYRELEALVESRRPIVDEAWSRR